MAALAANLAVFVSVLLAALSLLLAAVAVLSYRRVRHPRLAWIAVAFLGFLGKGAYASWQTIADRGGPFPWLAVADLAIVAALYLAVLRR